MRRRIGFDQAFGQRSVAIWTVLGGVCTLIALLVALFSLLPGHRSDADRLDAQGIWTGRLVGTTGTLDYRFELAQDGTRVTGKARAQDPENPQRFVLFRIDGQVDQQTFAFEETQIVDSSPQSSWCLISASLFAGDAGALAGTWNTTRRNPLPSCAGIHGNLTVRRQGR